MHKDFFIDQNTDFESLVTIRNPVSSEYLDINGASFVGTIRKGPETSISYDTFSCAVVDSGNSTIKISLTRGQTANLEQGRYVYDIMMTDSNDKRIKLLSGTVIIKPSPTR